MEMPILKPVPIKTKGLPRLKKIKVWLTESRKWTLYKDWTYETRVNGSLVTIEIKKGFIFDGASIPRPLWWLFNPMGIFMVPGLVHDYAYRNQELVTISGHKIHSSSQATWDDLFRQVSIEVNDMKISSVLAWAALRMFGSFAWRKNRKLQTARVLSEWEGLKETHERYGKFKK